MLCKQVKSTAGFMLEPLHVQKGTIARIGQLSEKLNKPIPKESKAAIDFFKRMYKEQKTIRRRPRAIRRLK